MKAVIFDFDDTLVATLSRIATCMVKAFHDFGYDVNRDQILEYWGRPFREVIMTLQPTLNYNRFISHYGAIMLEHPPTIHIGARDILEGVQALDAASIVVSSSSKILIEQDLRIANLDKFFDGVWSWEDCQFHKPDPRVLNEPISYLRQGYNLENDRIAYIGDSINDYIVAKENQIKFFGVTTGLHTVTDFLVRGASTQDIYCSLYELAISEEFHNWIADA